MKYILYLVVGLILYSCQKEDILSGEKIAMENLYVIQDNPDDPIQHRRYEIYKTYNVPVFFNDTVGKSFTKLDRNGDSLFIWETLAYRWSYTGVSGFNYEYFYMNDPQKQSVMLDVVESYLKKASKVLYPYSIFLVDSLYATSKNQFKSYGTTIRMGNTFYRDTYFSFGFKTMLIAGFVEEDVKDLMTTAIMKAQIKEKIGNFEKELVPFYLVSKTEWYQKLWIVDLGVPRKITVDNTSFDFEAGYATSDTHKPMFSPYPKTPEQRAAIAKEVRKHIGAFGFVGGGITTPEDSKKDLNSYLDEMLRRTPEEFAALWGSCPLVMKKYAILYDIIVNGMEIKL